MSTVIAITEMTYKHLIGKKKEELVYIILDLLKEKEEYIRKIDELEEYKWMYEDNSR